MVIPEQPTTWRHAGTLCRLASVLTLTCAASSPALALPPTCSAADYVYGLVQREAVKAVAEYATCVSQAFGRDDCSSQFSAVAETQMRFARAAADVRTRCNQ